MRILCGLLVCMAMAGTAGAEVMWAGLGVSTNWEFEPVSSPGDDWLHADELSPSLFVAFPVDDDTLFRVRAVDLPHDELLGGEVWAGSLTGVTAGIDYFLPGVFGEAVFSGGIGAYRLSLDADSPPPGVEGTRFGWYLGVGEWFQLSPRMRITTEVTWNRTSHRSRPRILQAGVGLAVSF